VTTNGLKSSNFKERLWSAKVLTTIVWIFFPLSYIAIIIILNELYPSMFDIHSVHYISPIFAPLELKGVLRIGFFSTLYIPPILYMIVLFLFSVYPAIYSTKKFFKKRGNANAIIEYQFIRKILFALLITEIVITVVTYVLSDQLESLRAEIEDKLAKLAKLDKSESFAMRQEQEVHTLIVKFGFTRSYVQSLLIAASMLPAAAIFILIKLLLEYARNQFRFYYAKTCFEILIKTGSEADKAEYLFRGLDWYNKFIKRVTRSGIDIETIYSKIISNSPLSNNILLSTIMESFPKVDELKSIDELKPMRQMLGLLSCWKEGDFLAKESLINQLRELSGLLIPIVTVIITIISTFLLQQTNTKPIPGH
jgi:hypothetical protein